MAVHIRGYAQRALPDVLADPRPGHAGQVQERDAAMAQVVRAERRHAGCRAGAGEGGAGGFGDQDKERKARKALRFGG